MAAEEVIHFPFWAQPLQRHHSPPVYPPEPVAKSPPWQASTRVFSACGEPADRAAACVDKAEAVLTKLVTSRASVGAALLQRMERSVDKTDSFAQIYLWNLHMDRLIRVLSRLELHSIDSPRELKLYALRLQEIRAELNASFLEVVAARERADAYRYWFWRTAAEKQEKRPN